MRDITDWEFLGHGEMSTLRKEDLSSPDGKKYVMKYPRPFDGTRVNWEDINEVIAAELVRLLGLAFVPSEIAYRHDERGCLMRHFIDEHEADYGEVGAALLTAQLEESYAELVELDGSSSELTKRAFTVIERFSYFKEIKFEFIAMNIFDILIGNQDRHPFNWQILFKGDKSYFGPLYDNGASLGWQLSDDQLEEMLEHEPKMNRYFKNTEVKAGLYENKTPPLKAKDVITYLSLNHSIELNKVIDRLRSFNWDEFILFINEFPLISETRKKFTIRFIEFRMDKIIELVERLGE